MNFDELIKEYAHDFFVIVTGSLLGTIIYCLIFEPNSSVSLAFLIWILIFSALGDAVLFVFYSKKELTEIEMRRRYWIHFITLEIVLLILGYLSGMYHDWKGGIVFALIVAGVYGMVRLTQLQMDRYTASCINRKLREYNFSDEDSNQRTTK